MESILILGAGIYQVPLILRAKSMGLRAVVASVYGDYPGFRHADEVCYVNTTDGPGILDVSERHQVKAICTTGTDVAVPALAHACAWMGLKGISVEAAAKSSDKAAMKEAFRKHGVSTAAFRVICSFAEAQTALREFGPPVMLKIVDMSGSRGITRIDAENELEGAYCRSRAITNASHMVLEKYISGREIGFEALVQNGRIKLLLPHDKIMYHAGKTAIPFGHVFPIDCSKTAYSRIMDEAIKVIEALGFDNCAVNMDIFLTEEEDVFIIEAAGRAGATGIPELVSYYCGCDFYRAVIDCALGNDVDLTEGADRPCASLLLGSEHGGILQGMECMEPDGRINISMDYTPGMSVPAFLNGTHRIGHVIFTEESRPALLELIDRFRRSLKINVEPHQETRA